MADYGDRNRDRSSSIFSDDDRGDSWRSESNQDRWRNQDQGSRSHGSGGNRDWSQGDRDRGSDDDRGFFSRAGDEIRSWFGDEEAERRRERDARHWEQEHGTSGGYRGGGHEDQWTGRRPDQSNDRWSQGGRSPQRSQMRSNTGSSGYGQDDRGPGGYGGSGSGGGQSFGEVGQSGFRSSGQSLGGSPHDESYRRWRDQQIAQLDSEYDEYCRHRQSQFEQDFSSFRQNRQGGQMNAGQGSGGFASDGAQMGGGMGGTGQQNAGSTTTAGGNASAATSSTGSSNADVASGNELTGAGAGSRSGKGR